MKVVAGRRRQQAEPSGGGGGQLAERCKQCGASVRGAGTRETRHHRGEVQASWEGAVAGGVRGREPKSMGQAT